MLRMYSVYDKELKKYSNPLFFEINPDPEAIDKEAIRAFKTQLFDRKNLIAMFPDNYVLCYLGEFDEFVGNMIVSEDVPDLVITGDDAVKELRDESEKN